MPRIPAALAVLAVLTFCIVFNSVRYPAVRQMASIRGPSAEAGEATGPASSPSVSEPGKARVQSPVRKADGANRRAAEQPVMEKAEAAKPRPQEKQSAPPAMKPAAPAEEVKPAQPADRVVPDAASAPAELPKDKDRQGSPPANIATQPPREARMGGPYDPVPQKLPEVASKAQTEGGLIPVIRRTPGAISQYSDNPVARSVSGRLASDPTPLGTTQPAKALCVERLPPANQVVSSPVSAPQPDLPPGSVLIYPTTNVK